MARIVLGLIDTFHNMFSCFMEQKYVHCPVSSYGVDCMTWGLTFFSLENLCLSQNKLKTAEKLPLTPMGVLAPRVCACLTQLLFPTSTWAEMGSAQVCKVSFRHQFFSLGQWAEQPCQACTDTGSKDPHRSERKFLVLYHVLPNLLILDPLPHYIYLLILCSSGLG